LTSSFSLISLSAPLLSPSFPFLRDDDDADALQNHFPDGQHPLEGVPNFKELSAPEGLKGKSRYVPFHHGL
jgi:hypothetical protein